MANLFSAFCSWCRKGFLWNPTIMIDPVAISCSTDFEKQKPLIQNSCGSANSNLLVPSRIKRLFLSGSPSTIFGTIISIVINSLYCKIFCVSIFHILVKPFKRIFPHRTYSYSSATIVFITNIFLIVTACFYSTPNSINFGLGFIMSGKMSYNLFSIPTATAFAFTENEVVSNDDAAFTQSQSQKNRNCPYLLTPADRLTVHRPNRLPTISDFKIVLLRPLILILGIIT